MKMKNNLLVILILTASTTVVNGQSFNGFQTIGTHSFFVSLSWDGSANIGLGYNFRNFETSFSDYQIEGRVPFDDFNTLDKFKVIAGVYRPASIQRTFLGGGTHLIYNHSKEPNLVLSLTALPSWVYASSLGNQPYGTTGVILNYQVPLLGENAFKGHQFGVGLHLDLSLERTLGLSLNELRTVQFKDEEPIWGNELSFYAGSTYRLRRR
jgi:hypothetical protein